MASALVILADGFEEIEAVTPIDILRRAEVKLTVAGLGGSTAQGAHGVGLHVDCALELVQNDTFDAVILPGGMPGSKTLGETERVREVVVRHHEAEKIVAAICAAPAYALAKFGVLSGRKATCYPGCEELFPNDVTATGEPLTCDGHIVTSMGPGTAARFALELAGRLAGSEKADQLRAAMKFA